jgi:hypothetical protein
MRNILFFLFFSAIFIPASTLIYLERERKRRLRAKKRKKKTC